jgi:hypothetical protein
MNKLKYFLVYLSAWFITGCGRVAYDLSSPKAAVIPTPKPSEVFSVAVDTLYNILSNSLLEITMVIVAIVLYLRYLAFKRQQYKLIPSRKGRDFVNFKTEESAWHFNEEEKQ